MPTDDPLVSDESLAIRAGADFPLLLDPDQLYASGSDGSFAPGSFDLASASNDFGVQGVPEGAAVLIGKVPSGGDDRDESLWFAEEAVGDTLTIHRKGYARGAGVPPGRELGTSGLAFRVLSLDPQIRRASAALRARYRLDPDDPAAPTPSRPGLLAEACVLSVLADRYLAAAAGTGEQEDSFLAKSKEYRALLDSLLAELDALVARDLAGSGSQGGYAHGRIRTGTDLGCRDTGIRLPLPGPCPARRRR